MSDETRSTDWAIGRLEQALQNLDRVAQNRDEWEATADGGDYAEAAGAALEALKHDRRNADSAEAAIEDVLDVLEVAEAVEDQFAVECGDTTLDTFPTEREATELARELKHEGRVPPEFVTVTEVDDGN